MLLSHLNSIGAFPNSTLNHTTKNHFTGQFITLFMLTHIDFHSTIHSNERYNSGSVRHSMSFEFHLDTFKELFAIIEKLTIISTQAVNINLLYILIICLKLFNTHLKFLFAITDNSSEYLLSKDDHTIISIRSGQNMDFDKLIFDNDDLQTWFDTLLILSYRESETLEQNIICRLASKCLIQILNKRVSSFLEKLCFIHQITMQNQCSILIEELLSELNTNTSLLHWIKVLCDDKPDSIRGFDLLCSFLGIYFDSSLNTKPNIKQQIKQIIQRFQQFVFMQLSSAHSFANKYIIYILNNFQDQLGIVNELLDSILVYLGLMNEIHFDFQTLQSIVTTILPLITEFILKNSNNEIIKNNNLYYLYWLLGKMCHIFIVGPQNDQLETKYIEKLESPLFAGECEMLTSESEKYVSNLFESNLANYMQFNKSHDYFELSSSDQEFLMSIYNNSGEGARLISKLKLFIKDNQCLTQKSIQEQATHASRSLLVVYLKFYRRINLAQSELTNADDKKPHKKLLLLFEYTNYVYLLFARTKGQGGNCDELYDQIKTNALFLLTSIKQSDFIPIIESNTNDSLNKSKLNQQNSHANIKKRHFRLLRNMFLACTQFRKLILVNREINEEKEKNETLLRQAIDSYIFYGNNSEANKLVQCMSKQYERAIARLMMYKFINQILENLISMNNQNQIQRFLEVTLLHIRKTKVDWSYWENISSIPIQLKEDISKSYYSIIKKLLDYLLQSTAMDQTILIKNLFYLLDLSYKSNDIYHLFNNEFLKILCNRFMNINTGIKFITYNWLRLYVLSFCENLQLEVNPKRDEIQEFIFNEIILNKIKLFRALCPMKKENKTLDETVSLTNVTIEWFIKAKDKNTVSPEYENNLYINQYLMILLRCINFYEHIQSFLCN